LQENRKKTNKNRKECIKTDSNLTEPQFVKQTNKRKQSIKTLFPIQQGQGDPEGVVFFWLKIYF